MKICTKVEVDIRLYAKVWQVFLKNQWLTSTIFCSNYIIAIPAGRLPRPQFWINLFFSIDQITWRLKVHYFPDSFEQVGNGD